MGLLRRGRPRRRGSGALTPERAVLLLAGAGLLALVAVPGARRDPGPTGAITGIVTDAHGLGQEHVPVLLFSARGEEPAELTHTDGAGRFALQLAFTSCRLLALPTRASGFAPTWRAELGAGSRDLRIELDLATPVQVVVQDAAGFPMQGAELAVFSSEREGSLATDFALTDAAGQATVLATRGASLAARRAGFGPYLGPFPVVGPEDGPGDGALRVRLRPVR